jgi:hypothetical protein
MSPVSILLSEIQKTEFASSISILLVLRKRKASADIARTRAGMQTDPGVARISESGMETADRNTKPARLESRELGSNVMKQRGVQPAKRESQNESTDEGMRIACLPPNEAQSPPASLKLGKSLH